MPKINLLPEEVVAKIAAGEVIDRPASVVKELVENSLDAGATQIRIELYGGGLEEITVYDDGEGMEPEDLRLSFKRHTTSKIKSLSDLYSLLTLGFRGEALASIAEVSKLTIKSRAKGLDTGYEVYVEFGKEVSFKPSALKQGTLVSVKDLFANLPARKAFLKSKRTETAKALEIIRGIMLSHPAVKWEVFVEGEPYFRIEAGREEAILAELLSIDERYLLTKEYAKLPYHLKLILTSQEKVYPHTRYLYFFVNRRWVKDERLGKLFVSLLKKYYGSYGFPAGVVSISLPPQLVDFNVHPAKWEVRFRREEDLFHLFSSALEDLFGRRSSFIKERTKSKEKEEIEDLPLSFDREVYRVSESDFVPPYEIKTNISQPQGKTVDKGLPFFEKEYTSKDALHDFRLIGAFKRSYLLVEKGDELFIIDQHALAERIIYERLKAKAKDVCSQKLIIGKTIPLDEVAFSKFLALKDELLRQGFIFKILQEGTILILGVPDYLAGEDVEWVLRSLLEEEAPALDLRDELLKKTSCLLARKKGELLSEEEKLYLVERMFRDSLFTCPHGRPIFYKLSLSELKNLIRA